MRLPDLTRMERAKKIQYNSIGVILIVRRWDLEIYSALETRTEESKCTMLAKG